VGCVALDGLDEVWDQLVPAFEFDIDVRPTLFDVLTQADEAVVGCDEPDHRDQDEHADDDQDYEQWFHGLGGPLLQVSKNMIGPEVDEG